MPEIGLGGRSRGCAASQNTPTPPGGAETLKPGIGADVVDHHIHAPL